MTSFITNEDAYNYLVALPLLAPGVPTNIDQYPQLLNFQKKNGHIKRPPNDFMVFKTVFLNVLKPMIIHHGGSSGNLSIPTMTSVASKYWHSLGPDVQSQWKALAAVIRRRHAEKHENYRFCPKKRARKNTSTPQVAPAPRRRRRTTRANPGCVLSQDALDLATGPPKTHAVPQLLQVVPDSDVSQLDSDMAAQVSMGRLAPANAIFQPMNGFSNLSMPPMTMGINGASTQFPVGQDQYLVQQYIPDYSRNSTDTTSVQAWDTNPAYQFPQGENNSFSMYSAGPSTVTRQYSAPGFSYSHSGSNQALVYPNFWQQPLANPHYSHLNQNFQQSDASFGCYTLDAGLANNWNYTLDPSSSSVNQVYHEGAWHP